jgi:hypothetical protein
LEQVEGAAIHIRGRVDPEMGENSGSEVGNVASLGHFSSSTSRPFCPDEAERMVRAGSRVNRRFTYETKTVRVNFANFVVVIPYYRQVREMVPSIAGKELIYAPDLTNGSLSGRRIDQFSQGLDQLGAHLFILIAWFDYALWLPAAEIYPDAALEIRGQSKCSSARPVDVRRQNLGDQAVAELPGKTR